MMRPIRVILPLAVLLALAAAPAAAQEDDPPCPQGMFRQGDNGCMKKLSAPALPAPKSPADAYRRRCIAACSATVSRCVAACGADGDCNNHCSDDRFYACLDRCKAPAAPP